MELQTFTVPLISDSSSLSEYLEHLLETASLEYSKSGYFVNCKLVLITVPQLGAFVTPIFTGSPNSRRNAFDLGRGHKKDEPLMSESSGN